MLTLTIEEIIGPTGEESPVVTMLKNALQFLIKGMQKDTLKSHGWEENLVVLKCQREHPGKFQLYLREINISSQIM